MIISPPSGDDFEADLGKYLIQKHANLSIGDELIFVVESQIAPRSQVALEGQFYGPVVGSSGPSGGQISYRAISRLAQLQYRHTFPTAYGSGVPDSGTTHLPLSAVLSSDPPSQSAGSDQYVVGRIWGLNSLIWPDAGEWSSDGIWTCEDAGTLSRIGAAAIYYCGVLCSEVSTPEDLTGGTFRVYRGAEVLMVRGAGSGDVYGPIHAGNAFDTGIRLGDIETDDNIFVGIQIGLGTECDFLAAIVRDMGMFISIRDRDEATYINVVDSPPGRGSFDSPYAVLVEGDILNWERMSYSGIPPNAIFGLGKGEQYSMAGSIRGAMVAELVDTSESFKSPWGSLSSLVSDRYNLIRAGAKLKIETSVGYLKEGDWIQADIMPGEFPVGQILHIDDNGSGVFRLVVGGADGVFEDVALSPGAEADYVRRLYGYSETNDSIKMSHIGAVYIAGSSGTILRPKMASAGDGNLIVISPVDKRVLLIDPVTKKLILEHTSEYFDTPGIGVIDGIAYTHRCQFPLNNMSDITPYTSLGYTEYGFLAINSDYIYIMDYSGSVVRQYNLSDKSYVGQATGCSHPTGIFANESYLFVATGYWEYGIKKFDMDRNLLAYHSTSIASGAVGADDTYIWRDVFSGLDGKHYIYKHNVSNCAEVGSRVQTALPNGYGGVVAEIDPDYIYILKYQSGVPYSVIYKVRKSDRQVVDAIGESELPTAFEMEFTTKDFGGGAAKVLFTLECQESGDYSWGSIQGTFRVYVNDSLAAVLRNRTVAGKPIDSLDITAWLNLDGSTETIEIFGEWDNPLEEISFLGYVEGTQGYIP